MPSQELMQAVLALINAENDLMRKRVLDTHTDLLLTDAAAADQLLADWFSQSKGNAEYTHLLEECRAFLRRQTTQKPLMPSEELVQAALALIGTENDAESKRVTSEHADLLLTDEAEQLLNDWLTQSAGDYARTVQERLALLARCRKEGISSVFAKQVRPCPSKEKVQPAPLALVEAKSGKQREQLIRQQQDILLSDAADDFLAAWIENVEDSLEDDVIRHLRECRTLLANCRDEGIEAAFAHQAPPDSPPSAQPTPELLALLNENYRLTDRRDMPRRVELCQAALTLVDRDTQPEKWGDLQNTLGFSLCRNPLGDRAENLEQAIDHGKQALLIFTRHTFPEKWARSMNNLAAAYNDRIRGERAENIELAISFYEQAQQVYTRQAAPKEWAASMSNLAAAYNHRIKGERAENIELAIYYLKQALQVVTWQAFPYQWATSMNNLAEAYRGRIRGERAKNIELAISLYEQALQVVTRQAAPKEWAASMSNLASAYGERIKGERAENIELAISFNKQSLEVYTRQAAPKEWARSMNNLALALALYNRIRGERTKNIELAISFNEQALQVYTRQAFPYEWARSMNNLAEVYRERIRGERAENIERAISFYQQVLEVYTRQAYPEKWARSMNNLAAAYLERIKGERAENIEQAISLYEQAQQVWTHQAFPEKWARSMNNLAAAYLERIRGERAENIELAISFHQQAQQIWTRQAFPYEWATSMSHLAAALYNRIRGERADNIELAIEHFQQALEVRKPQSFPQDCRETACSLGRLLYDEGRFALARQAFVTAHEAVEALRGEVPREAGKRELSEENADLYARLVYCCLHDANADEEAAFEYAAAGKGRTFVDMLASARLDLSAAGADDAELAADLYTAQELRQQIDNLLAYLSDDRGLSYSLGATRANLTKESNTEKGVPKEELRSQLQALQEQEAAYWEEMSFKYPKLTATQKAPALSAAQACALAAKLDATLVEYYRHAQGWCAFVVTPEEVRYVALPDVTDEFVQEMVKDWLEQIEEPRFQTIASYWTLDEWYEALITPLGLPAKGKVVLAPAGILHLMPLSIARHPKSEAYLCDQYNVTFAPSLGALRMSLAEAQKAEAKGSLLVAAYPSKPPRYLKTVIPEAKAIATHFPHVTPLHAEAATPQAVIAHAREQEVVHFSCHAGFDSERPQQSGFELSDGYLTVQRIITELRLSDTRLATLSACKTHRVALGGGEEHVGLVQSLMIAGAKSIVASLWSVEEQSTRVLFEHFYSAVAAGEAPATALQKAMRVVREQPGWEHPYYWAAFQVSGLGF